METTIQRCLNPIDHLALLLMQLFPVQMLNPIGRTYQHNSTASRQVYLFSALNVNKKERQDWFII